VTKNTANRRLFVLASLASCGLLALPACRIPDFRRPQCGKEVPATFEQTSSVEIFGNTGQSSAQVPWCEFFNDPTLNSLINEAFVYNQELKILAEDIRIAQYEVQARSGAYLPFFSLGARAGIEKPSRFTRAGAVEDQLQVAPGKGFPEPLPDFLIATNVTWEIDIWRRLRNAQAAAAYRYLGTQEGRNFVVTRLIADIADNYYRLLALDNRLQILDSTIQIQQKSLETANFLKAAGQGTELGVQRFQAEVRRNQSEKYIVQQEIIEVENEINFAVGRFPQMVERQAIDYINLNMHALSVGLPSQLLQNRADIRQAERELAAAGLEVAVARARFFPSLVLTAGVGYEAFNPKYLFDPEALMYNAAGELVAPLINRRAIRADYQTANAQQLQAVYNYQRTVLNAFTEVINFMTAVQNYGYSITIKKEQVRALERSVDVVMNLFQSAQAEYIDVLLAQRDLMEARTVLVQTKQRQLAAIVNAYQALGGGGAPTVSENSLTPDGQREEVQAVPAQDGQAPNPAEPVEALPVPPADDSANQ
jgi:NodT family efflux transporter outer membrane factor (OMF) lipoprotein